MGPEPLPVDEHRRRPPIPIVPVDERARAAALVRGADEQLAWLAAVTGDATAAEARTRFVDANDVEVLRTTLAARRDVPGMTVGEVALAVDAGREIAGRAAADGMQLLVGTAPDGRDDGPARAVADALRERSEDGPLRALRRFGDATTGVLCGVALGAGEHGLGCLCDGVAALAGAAVAAGIEPDLRPRLAALAVVGDPERVALAAWLGIVAINPVRDPSPRS